MNTFKHRQPFLLKFMRNVLRSSIVLTFDNGLNQTQVCQVCRTNLSSLWDIVETSTETLSEAFVRFRTCILRKNIWDTYQMSRGNNWDNNEISSVVLLEGNSCKPMKKCQLHINQNEMSSLIDRDLSKIKIYLCNELRWIWTEPHVIQRLRDKHIHLVLRLQKCYLWCLQDVS